MKEAPRIPLEATLKAEVVEVHPLNQLVDLMQVAQASGQRASAMPEAALQTLRARELAVAAVAARVPSVNRAVERQVEMVAPAVQTISLGLHSSMAVAAVAEARHQVLVNTVAETAHLPILETMVLTTLVAVQVRQRQEAACQKAETE